MNVRDNFKIFFEEIKNADEQQCLNLSKDLLDYDKYYEVRAFWFMYYRSCFLFLFLSDACGASDYLLILFHVSCFMVHRNCRMC